MASGFKEKAIRDYLEAQVGAPVINALDEEIGAFQTSVNLALLLYWQAFPFVYRKSFDSQMQGEIIIDVDGLMQEVFQVQAERDQAYFLGIMRLDDNVGGVAGGANIDSYLLGAPMYSTFHSSYSGTGAGFSSSLDIQQMTQYKAMTSAIYGEPEIEYDNTKGVITILTNSGFSQITTWFGFGFTEDSGIKYLRNNQLDLFRKMAACEFLNVLLNARTQIRLSSSDFSIDAEAMTKRRNELTEEVKKGISDQSFVAMGWG